MNIPKQYGVMATVFEEVYDKTEAIFSFGKLSLSLLDLLNIMPLVQYKDIKEMLLIFDSITETLFVANRNF